MAVQVPPKRGDVIERDGKRYRVVSVMPRLTRATQKRDQFVTVEGHTLGLVEVDSPIPAVQYAQTLEDLKQALPHLHHVLLHGLGLAPLGSYKQELLRLALDDLRKLVPHP